MWIPLRSAKMNGLHLGVPAPGLVAEVDAGLEQLPHRNGRHGERPPVGSFLRGPRRRGPEGCGPCRHRPGRNGPRVCSTPCGAGVLFWWLGVKPRTGRECSTGRRRPGRRRTGSAYLRRRDRATYGLDFRIPGPREGAVCLSFREHRRLVIRGLRARSTTSTKCRDSEGTYTGYQLFLTGDEHRRRGGSRYQSASVFRVRRPKNEAARSRAPSWSFLIVLPSTEPGRGRSSQA